MNIFARNVGAAVLAFTVITACERDTELTGPFSILTIEISPNPHTLAIRETQQFTAVGKNHRGETVPFDAVWTVTAGGGSVSGTGLFTAGDLPGTYTSTVTASNGVQTSTATVTVTVGPLATITVTPVTNSLEIGALQQFSAVGRDAGGNIVSITPTWSVVGGGGSVSPAGVFTAGMTAGAFQNTVQATSGSISGRASVTVNPGALASIVVTPNPMTLAAGATQQFTAAGRDIGGNTVAAPGTWTATAGGTINATTGAFTAGNTAGTFNNAVRFTSGLLSNTATVIVQPGPLASIVVSPNPTSVAVNGVRQFTAAGRDASGNTVAITPTWSVVNGGGTINATSGAFTAGSVAGTFSNSVRAASGGIAGTATVAVTSTSPPPAGSINLGAAAANGIMAGTAVTCVQGGIINADVSISPGNTITGFGPCVITGVQHLNDATAVQAQIDLTTAYNTLAGLPCGTNIVANLGGTTLTEGVYCTGSGIGVTGVLTLDGGGNPNARFVFQAGSTLTTAGNIVLINGAQASNVYWQVGSSATIGTASQWQGNIIALTSITLVDNATLIGRALARNGAVSLGTNNVITLP